MPIFILHDNKSMNIIKDRQESDIKQEEREFKYPTVSVKSRVN